MVMDENGRQWAATDGNRPKWIKMDENGFRTSAAKFGFQDLCLVSPNILD